jgi:uncharacterized protein YkwD
MRSGLAVAIALIALASAAAAASDAAVSRPLATQVELQLRSAAKTSSPATTRTPKHRRARSGTAALEYAVVARMNEVRRRHGLRPLRHNPALASAADFHSRDMARKGYFEHDSANGTAFWRRIERFYPSRGFRSWTVGENLLWGTDTYGAAFAVREWMHSPPHRENILSRGWREVGIGAVAVTSAPGEYRGRAVTIVTADFGSRT